MKDNRHLLIVVFILVCLGSFNLVGAEHDVAGYFRAGSGTNSLGGDQECFHNAGSTGNEFRLGNECGSYGEILFKIKHMKKDSGRKFFNSVYRMDFFPENHSTEDKTNDFRIRELYVEAGNLFKDDSKSFWIGKRLYRDADLHMLDFFYFADTSGNGGGVGNIDTGIGTLEIAQLREVGSTQTEVGKRGTSFLDLRLKGIRLSDASAMMLWLGHGQAKATGDSSSKNHTASGNVLAIKIKTKLDKGSNTFSLSYGDGLMEGLKLSTPDSANEDAKTYRLVNDYSISLSESIELQFAAVYEEKDNGDSTNSKSTWSSIGVRPIYFFNDHYSLATEFGHSEVHDEADGNGVRTLSRVTIAPQISLNKGFYARPVLRAFYTMSFWNDANQSSIATKAPSYIDKNEGGAYGLQAEVWF